MIKSSREIEKERYSGDTFIVKSDAQIGNENILRSESNKIDIYFFLKKEIIENFLFGRYR